MKFPWQSLWSKVIKLKLVQWFLTFPFRITVVVAALLLVAGEAGLFRILNETLAKPIEFRSRSSWGRDPTLDPRIKIFGFDDITLNALGRPGLNFSEWKLLLTHLSSHGPRVIIIDQAFQVVDQGPEVQDLVASAPQGVPIVAGVFASGHPIVGRLPISENPLFPNDTAQELPWPGARPEHLYGSAMAIRPLFSGFGAINYSTQGKLPVALQSGSGGVFPSLGLTAADALSLDSGGISAAGRLIPVTREGLVQVNQASLRSYYPQIKTIASALDAARAGRSIHGLNSGDTIFILPLMYSGNADFKSTPLGEFPGGLLHVAMANSVLKNDWIRYFGNDLVLALLGALLSVALAHRFPPFKSSMLIFGQVILILALGIGAFIWGGIVTPWAETGFCALIVGFSAIAERARALERRSMQIRHTLAGLVSPKLLQFLLNSPQGTLESSRRSEVTVMFIDIEGFSGKMQGEDPNLVFTMLKYELSHLCEIVQRHGGIVDKTLGDGLLCYFGYTFDPTMQHLTREHAFAAMSCALDIQIDSSRRAQAHLAVPVLGRPESQTSGMVFPLRIGLTTGEVLIGNVGNRERIDMTIIGSVVNRAKRYEDSCESFRIMMDAKTRQLLSKDPESGNCVMRIGDLTYTLWHREIIVKHQDELWSGWECNPFEHSPATLNSSLAAVSAKGSQVQQGDTRLALGPVNLTVRIGDSAVCRILTLSATEMVVSAPKYLPKRAFLDLHFWGLSTDEIEEAGDPMDSVTLAADFMTKFQGHRESQTSQSESELLTALSRMRLRATVLWGIQEAGQSRHGLKLVGLAPEVRTAVLEALFRFKASVESERSVDGEGGHGLPRAV